MNHRHILEHVDHRPYPMPQGPWMMEQTWNQLLFAHWPVEEEALLPYLPQGLQLDKWEGTPWISVSPFSMHPLRVRGLPPIPFTQRFLELNVRTYAILDNNPGIVFLTLEASSRLAVAGARTIAHLPYHHAEMHCNYSDPTIQYFSKRQLHTGQEAVFKGDYRPVDSTCFHAAPGSLAHWLTERYCLYTTNTKGQLYRGDIHHLPWPLQKADLDIHENTLTPSFGLTHEPAPSLISFTKRLEVLFWPLKKV